LLRDLEKLQIELILLTESARIAALQLTSALVERIKASQGNDPELVKIMQKVEKGVISNFSMTERVLRFKDRLCVADHPELRKESLRNLTTSHFPHTLEVPKCIGI